jgi:hypothetical protein
MQTQHKIQLDERDGNPGLVRPPVAPYLAPPQQGMAQHAGAGGYPAATPQVLVSNRSTTQQQQAATAFGCDNFASSV